MEFRENCPRPKWRHVVSDSESERSRKFLQPENDPSQGQDEWPQNSEIWQKIRNFWLFLKMACRDGDFFSLSYSNTSLEQQLENWAEMGWRIFRKLFHKNDDISLDTRCNFVRSVLDRYNCSRFQILRARDPGKFLSLRTTPSRSGKMTQKLRKVISPRELLNFFGPAGGSRTLTGAFAPRQGKSKS